MIKRTITIGLNQKEIQNLISELDKIPKKMDKMREKITDDLAEIGLNEMVKNFNNSTYYPSEGMDFAKVGTSKEKKVSMIGSQAIYYEFGTGTEGKQNPDPQKNDFSPALKPYNSGKTIRKNNKADSVATEMGIPVGGLYWTYKTENGIKVYTQGIPAQKIVYEADKTVKEKLPEVCRKAVEEVLK